jgi:hypothetical protein
MGHAKEGHVPPGDAVPCFHARHAHKRADYSGGSQKAKSNLRHVLGRTGPTMAAVTDRIYGPIVSEESSNPTVVETVMSVCEILIPECGGEAVSEEGKCFTVASTSRAKTWI